MFTNTRHCILLLITRIQSTCSQTISVKCTFLLISHLHLGLPGRLIRRFSEYNCTRISRFPHTCCLAHLILLHINILIPREEYEILFFSLCNFLHPPCYFLLLMSTNSLRNFGHKNSHLTVQVQFPPMYSAVGKIVIKATC